MKSITGVNFTIEPMICNHATNETATVSRHIHHSKTLRCSVFDVQCSVFSSSRTFSAKERDLETGYSYFGARYYDATLSIWLSVDPLSDKYPSMSAYMYCAGNPVMLVDPDGREIELSDSSASILLFFLNTYSASLENQDAINEVMSIGDHSRNSAVEFASSQRNNRVTAKSLGLRKGQNPEQALSKLVNNMKGGEYINGSELNIIHSMVGMAITRIDKTSDNSFNISFTRLAKTLAKAIKGVDIESRDATINVSPRQGGGYNLELIGLKYEGQSNVYIKENRIYWQDNQGKWNSKEIINN